MNCGMTLQSSSHRLSSLGSAAWCACAVTVLALAWHGDAHAQMGGMGMGFGGAVGGISIDADGIVRNLDPRAVESLAKERREALAGGKANRGAVAKLRKVSLAKIVAAVKTATADRPLPPDVLFLGGLERITHVFIDTEGHDIILAGPADALTVDAAGNVYANPFHAGVTPGTWTQAVPSGIAAPVRLLANGAGYFVLDGSGNLSTAY